MSSIVAQFSAVAALSAYSAAEEGAAASPATDAGSEQRKEIPYLLIRELLAGGLSCGVASAIFNPSTDMSAAEAPQSNSGGCSGDIIA